MKLNKEIRQKIIENAMEKAGFTKRLKSIVQSRAEWAEKVRVESLGGKEKINELDALQLSLNELYAQVPEKLRNQSPKIRIDYEMENLNVAGLRPTCYFNGELDRCLPHVEKIAVRNYVLLADNPLTEEFHKIHETQETYNQDWDTLFHQVKAVVDSVSTTERLLKVWPESVELIPESAAPRSSLPAVQISELNSLIGFSHS